MPDRQELPARTFAVWEFGFSAMVVLYITRDKKEEENLKDKLKTCYMCPDFNSNLW